MYNVNSSGCGSKSCSCAATTAAVDKTIMSIEPTVSTENLNVRRDLYPSSIGTLAIPTAYVNGIALHPPSDRPEEDVLRQRAYAELLRQQAIRHGLLSHSDAATNDGIQSEDASSAIERLLEKSLVLLTPDEASCQRYFKANPKVFQREESVQLRHILFAVTPGVDVVRLRKRAEAALLDARCGDDLAQNKFEDMARQLSNCPSGEVGGTLGWLRREECTPEFAREVFGHTEVGVLPRLVHSRFGLHIVQVLERHQGAQPSYESVRGAVAQTLMQQSYVVALRQYLQLLAAEASIEGIAIRSADSPLVQ